MHDEELLRYSRHILLPEVDVLGQEKLLAAHALILGVGGLGSPVALYLAAAGVGEITLVDFDKVDLSNLQRQIVHDTQSIGELKVNSAKARLHRINPQIKINALAEKPDAELLAKLIAAATVVLDCTDNFATRFAINKSCVQQRKPLVSGAAIRLEGQVSVFDSRRDNSPCYRCLYEEIDDSQMSCAQNGVLAALVGIIGSVQATEALKIIAEFGEPLVGRLLVLDAKQMNWRELRLKKDPQCPVCALD